MAYTYAVLGGGRQGTAAAYDMARWGDAERVLIADISLEAAHASAGLVNDLIGRACRQATSWAWSPSRSRPRRCC
jgi:lysine 6-dehydrogenase